MSNVDPLMESASSQPKDSRASLRSRGTAVVVFASFGTFWLEIACWRMADANPVILGLVAIIGVGILLIGLRLAKEEKLVRAKLGLETPAKHERALWLINAFQWGLIFLLIVLLNIVRRVEWIAPGIIFIVGMHFFPLATLFRSRLHALLGAGLAILALIYPFFPAGPTSPAGPFIAGILLWLAAGVTLFEVKRAKL